MVSQQKQNLKIGDRFEVEVLEDLEQQCKVAAQVNETSNGYSTPDLLCVKQGQGNRDETVLVEAKFNSYLRPDQRDELVRIAEDSPDSIKIQVATPTPRGTVKRQTVKDRETSTEEMRETLETDYYRPDKEAKKTLESQYRKELNL